MISFLTIKRQPIHWSNTHKQFVGCCQRIICVCLAFLWGWHLKGKKITLTFSKSTIETLEKSVKYNQSEQEQHQNDIINVFLLLTLKK